jgi:large subunit ribosomal protein L17
MRHGVKKFKLNRTASHRKAMLKNLATSIIKQGTAEEQTDRQVKTTVIKAKAVRGLVDRLVTYAKKGDLSSRRQAAKFIQEPAVLKDLFEKVGPRYADRQGGYTRILKLSANRKGDNAEMAIITLVEDEVAKK